MGKGEFPLLSPPYSQFPIPNSKHSMATQVMPGADARLVNDVTRQVARRVVGQEYMVDRLLISLLTGGHVLLEGVPGLAKTLTVRTLAETVDTTFNRIQFTPDLLPAEVGGPP